MQTHLAKDLPPLTRVVRAKDAKAAHYRAMQRIAADITKQCNIFRARHGVASGKQTSRALSDAIELLRQAAEFITSESTNYPK